MINISPKTKKIVLIGALIGIALFWYMAWKTAVKEAETTQPVNTNENINVNAPVDFTKTGTVTYNNPGLKENTPYFIFEEPGSPALSKEIIFDELSVCVSNAGTLPCLSIDTAIDSVYGEKQTIVEGISQSDGSLLIRKLILEK